MQQYLQNKEGLVENVFNKVFDKYDLMNDFMSFGIHRIWKKNLLTWMNPSTNKILADVACGTGDITKMYLEIDISHDGTVGFSATRIGHAMIDYVEIEIGGQSIDKHYGEWIDLWTQLSSDQEQYAKLERLINGTLLVTNGTTGGAGTTSSKLYIPLQFWFNRNPGLALPLIALQYHEVKLKLQLKRKNLVDNLEAISKFIIFKFWKIRKITNCR